MKHPYESLPENPQAAVTIMTTEHFNLQTARSATISESNGRTSIFLGAVSAGLVALAFAGQTSRSTLLTFGLVLFPVLSFLGLVTFERVLQSSIEDTLYLQRINRIRRFYHEAAPGLSGYLGVAAPTDDIAAVLALDGYLPSRWQVVLSAVGMIGVINSVLLGAVGGFRGRRDSGRAPVAVDPGGRRRVRDLGGAPPALPAARPVPQAVPVRRCAASRTGRLIRVESPERVGPGHVVPDHPNRVRGEHGQQQWIVGGRFCSASSGARKTSTPAQPWRALRRPKNAAFHSTIAPGVQLGSGGTTRIDFGDGSSLSVSVNRPGDRSPAEHAEQA